VIALLLVTQDEAELLRANIRHHLEWGIDHVGVADNDSSDGTGDVVREFGDAVSYRRFDDFHDRQIHRTALLDALRARAPVEWVGVGDTDEFLWMDGATPAEVLATVPAEKVAVNFDMKLFLPTTADERDGAVFMRRRYRTASSASPLHTSYSAGKSFYRSEWLTTITDEHWCGEVPHEVFRHPEPWVHHYMVGDEDQFVQKVSRLIAWAPPPDGVLARRRWRRTPPDRRELPGWSAPFKKRWWAVYQQGGEEAVREHYRTVYTLDDDARRAALARGDLVEDGAFAAWARSRYAVAP
jgi:hypothetical protein